MALAATGTVGAKLLDGCHEGARLMVGIMLSVGCKDGLMLLVGIGDEVGGA